MWVMTTQGFYSVVAHRDLPGVMLVRARAKGDLVNLDRQIPGLEARITKDTGADYLWRATASREEWALAVARISQEVDYDNFKTAVARQHGSKRASVYHAVWSALTRIEKGFAKRYYHHGASSAGPAHISTGHELCAWTCPTCGEGCMSSEDRCPFCHTHRETADRTAEAAALFTTSDLRTPVGDGLAVQPLGHTPPAAPGRSVQRSKTKRQRKKASGPK